MNKLRRGHQIQDQIQVNLTGTEPLYLGKMSSTHKHAYTYIHTNIHSIHTSIHVCAKDTHKYTHTQAFHTVHMHKSIRQTIKKTKQFFKLFFLPGTTIFHTCNYCNIDQLFSEKVTNYYYMAGIECKYYPKLTVTNIYKHVVQQHQMDFSIYNTYSTG